MKDITICYWEFSNRFNNYGARSVAFNLKGWCSEKHCKEGKPPAIEPGFTISDVDPSEVSDKDCWAYAEKQLANE